MVETTQSGIRQRATNDAADTDQPAAGAGCTPRTRGGTPVKALCWERVNEVAVEKVPDPQIINKQDAIVKVKLSSVCGSNLHQISGYMPAMRSGDMIGHEFLGEIVEVGPEVSRTGGRGSDVCIEAIGLEARSPQSR
jgi:threonine dehydrogenase-like Zn-dependent dehydrogenase